MHGERGKNRKTSAFRVMLQLRCAQRNRKKRSQDDVDISSTLLSFEIKNINSAALERGATPQLNPVEFVIYLKGVDKKILTVSHFTAGKVLSLFGSIPLHHPSHYPALHATLAENYGTIHPRSRFHFPTKYVSGKLCDNYPLKLAADYVPAAF